MTRLAFPKPGRSSDNRTATGAPRIALTVDEAARSIGVSRDHWERHILPDLRVVYSGRRPLIPAGRRRLIPVKELERRADERATRWTPRCGAITSRAEAVTLRISLIYVLADSSPVIRREHLEAALEVWRYREDSARLIWGNATGDPVADELRAALIMAGPEGLIRTEINKLFSGNKDKDRIDTALLALYTAGLAEPRKPQGTCGRPPEHCITTYYGRNEKNERRSSE